MMYAYAASTKRSAVHGRPWRVAVAIAALAVVMSGQLAQAQPGWVQSHQKISDTQGGFKGILDNSDQFGTSVASLGDLDGDGIGDLAVGTWNDDDGGSNRGAVWILFLNADGTVQSQQKISDTQGGFTGLLDDNDNFGSAVGGLGDLDGDGVPDLAVGAWHDDDGGFNRGAVWILFLNTGGTVKSHQKISSTQGGFTGMLDNGDWFGYPAASLGDLDNDGVGDLAVGAGMDDDGGAGRGAFWVLFLNTDGTVKTHQKISDTAG
ncbi:MAG: integrin alpha, partial [Phycisphaerae bacterium]